MRSAFAALAAALLASGADAEIYLPELRAEDRAVVEACMAERVPTDWVECRGAVAQPCDAEAARTQIHASLDCVAREAVVWKTLMEERYETSLAEWRTRDAEGLARFEASQAAWLTYRDAECAFIAARTGNIRTDALLGLGCVLQENHERVIALRLAVY
jgi:uncharacterized protein YecT (DUF1311 family)